MWYNRIIKGADNPYKPQEGLGTMKIQYVAFDGRVFDNENDCRAYEDSKKIPESVIAGIAAIAEYCDRFSDCHGCPFDFSYGDCGDYDCDSTSCRLRNRYPIDWKEIELPK